MPFLNIGFIKRLISEDKDGSHGSIAVTDEEVIRRYVEDPDFPFLVSFPRTGSHWLRMLMELYFGRPSLVRVFYFKDRTDYMFLHTHDMGLDVRRRNVIYLYRNPVPTIFSQMMYEKEDIDDTGAIERCAGSYGAHLRKWLIEENASERKAVIRYENMTADLEAEFSKIAGFFSEALDPQRLKRAKETVTKDEVKKKTTHDEKAVNIKGDYGSKRQTFALRHSGLVEEAVFKDAPELKAFFV
jgi:hypothetical protein